MAEITYTDEVPLDFGIPCEKYVNGKLNPWSFEELTLEELGTLTDEELKRRLDWQSEREVLQRSDPIKYGYTLERWRAVMREWNDWTAHVTYGGNRCISGSCEIYDPEIDDYRCVSTITEPFNVLAWNGTELVSSPAGIPFQKDVGPIYKVTFSNGESVKVAGTHHMLTPDGWKALSDMRVGSRVLHYSQQRTSPDHHHIQSSCVQTDFRTEQGYLCDYRRDLHSCDGQLLEVQAYDQDVPPLSRGVPKCSHDRTIEGDPDDTTGYIPDEFYDALYREYHDLSLISISRSGKRHKDRLSPFVPNPLRGALIDPPLKSCISSSTETRDSCKKLSRLSDEFQNGLQSLLQTSVDLKTSSSPLRDQCCESLNLRESSYVVITDITFVANEVKWDFEVPGYHNYWYGGVIHHNSSKSSMAASIIVYLAMNIPEAELVCWSVDETSSINDQQRFIYEALPEAYKNMPKTKGKMYSVQYSQKNGFSGNKLIIPSKGDERTQRGSTIIFKNYRSYALNAQVAEGWKAHAVWLDEECPMTLFQTMRKRLWDYRGRLILTFTTLQGWTSLINNINSKAVTLETRFAEKGKPPRKVPYEQLSVNEDKCKIWYFWTQDNPFIPSGEAVEELSVRPDDEIMSRLYGICVKSATTKFPKFNRRVHVLKHNEIPFIKNPKMRVTRYQTLDPAGKKKWFFIYAGVTRSLDAEMPNIYIYDEFPDVSYGAWGLEDDTPKGRPGPGQKGLGWGINQYVATMRMMENGAEIFERGIDKRFAAATSTGMDGDTRLLDNLLLAGIRYVTPTTKRVDRQNEIELGCQSINDFLDYNETQEVGVLNSPHLFISERCLNLIECVENFTGEGGDTEIWKDGIDTLRILMDLNPRVVDWESLPTGRKGMRGY